MKTYFKTFLFALLLPLMFVSCTEDNLQPEGQWDLSEADIIYPEIGQNIVLDQNNPTETITFQWSEAFSSENFSVTYEVLIDSLDSNEFDTPLLQVTSNNNGKGLSADISHQDIDNALAIAGFAANESAEVNVVVKANSLSKSTFTVHPVNFTRFEQETLPTSLFVSGTAAENNNELENAIPLRRLNNSSGEPSAIFEGYTSFSSVGSFSLYTASSLPAIVYGGSNGVLSRNAQGIEVQESGEYRIQVDLENETYSLIKIENWSVVGAVITGGWGGDEALEYQGGGVWSASLDLVEEGNFVFRANGDWGILLKRIVGTSSNLALESEAESQGVVVEDVTSNLVGKYVVTLNLSGNTYNYSIVLDDSVPESIDAPDQLFLISNSQVIQEFTKQGQTFTSTNFIPFQSNENYSLNSQPDGSGKSYGVSGNILGESANPDGDLVSGTVTLLEGQAEFSISNDRSLRLNFDFSNSELKWTYYNFKLFHWNEWDSRDEFLMSYVHPNQYTIAIELNANYDMKFISPWDFDFGSTTPTAMSGDLINGGGENLKSINSTGTYNVTITLNDNFQAGTYVFE